MQRLRIIIADDHPVVLIGIARSLEEDGGMVVVGKASSVDELLLLLDTVPCDVVVTDYFMPGGAHGDGETMLDKVARKWPLLPVVLMTSSGNVALLSAAIERGVLAIVDKGASTTHLLLAVNSAARRRPWMVQELKERIQDVRNLAAKGQGLGVLSPAELKVVRMLSDGKTVTAIAALLHRDKGTISKQKTSAMAKLGVDNDVQLVDVVRGFLR